MEDLWGRIKETKWKLLEILGGFGTVCIFIALIFVHEHTPESTKLVEDLQIEVGLLTERVTSLENLKLEPAKELAAQLEVLSQLLEGMSAEVTKFVGEAEEVVEAIPEEEPNWVTTFILFVSLILLVIGIAVLTIKLSKR